MAEIGGRLVVHFEDLQVIAHHTRPHTICYPEFLASRIEPDAAPRGRLPQR